MVLNMCVMHCICMLAVLYMCDSGIHYASFYDFLLDFGILVFWIFFPFSLNCIFVLKYKPTIIRLEMVIIMC